MIGEKSLVIGDPTGEPGGGQRSPTRLERAGEHVIVAVVLAEVQHQKASSVGALIAVQVCARRRGRSSLCLSSPTDDDIVTHDGPQSSNCDLTDGGAGADCALRPKFRLNLIQVKTDGGDLRVVCPWELLKTLG